MKQELNSSLDKVTRFEVIDHTKDGGGRVLVKYDVSVELSLQDDNRTLKVFLYNRLPVDKKAWEL